MSIQDTPECAATGALGLALPAGLGFRLDIVLPVLVAAAVSLLLLYGGKVFLTVHANDFTVPLAGAWAVLHGQVPHLDFYSPVGAGYLLPYLWAIRWVGPSAAAALYAHVGAALVLLAVSMVLTRRRLPPVAGALFNLFVFMVAVSPRVAGDDWSSIDHMAAYNRWGWAVVSLLALTVLVPPRDRTAIWQGVDGALCALLLLALFYLKITYFVAGVGVLAIAVPLRTAGARLLAALAVVAVCCLLAVEALWALHHAYLSDLAMAAATTRTIDVRRLADAALAMPPAVMALAAAYLVFLSGLALSIGGQAAGMIRQTWPVVMALAALVMAAAVLALQNHQARESHLALVAGFVLFETLRRKVGEDARVRPRHLRLASLGGVACLAVMIGPVVGRDLAAIGFHARAVIADRNGGLVHLEDTPLSGLHVPRSLPPEYAADPLAMGDRLPFPVAASQEGYFAELRQALALLDGRIRPGDRIQALTFSNPFPFLTRTAPPRGGALWWDSDRNFSRAVHPSAASVLGDATIVLAAKHTIVSSETAELLREVYERDIEQEFEKVADSPMWVLWRRRDK